MLVGIMEFQTHTLPNGLKVLLAPIEGAETVTVMVMSGTGSRYENEQENGMAHFLEHMLFKGTKNRKTAKIISEAIDGVGGQLNAFTTKDHTAYYAKTDKRHFDIAFDVIADIFLNPTLPNHEIIRERGTVVEEINLYEDMPIRSVMMESDILLFGQNHPLGRNILGPKKNIQSFTRKQFLDYFARNYVAQNSAICIAGAFSPTNALRKAKTTFAAMREGTAPSAAAYEHTQTEPRVHLKYKNTDQTHFVLALPAYPLNHKDEAAADVLAAVLGGGMSGRLFLQVRERRGLAYYVRADQEQYSDIGALDIRAGVSNTALKEALVVTLAELQKLKRTRISDEELNKAKEYVKGTTALSLDTTDAKAQFIGHSVLVRGTTSGLREYNSAVNAVTAADVQHVAKELFKTERLNLTVIGPHKDSKPLLEALKFPSK